MRTCDLAPARLRQSVAALGLAAALLTGGPVAAQVTPAAGYTPPDDTPTIKVGAVIFADYTFQQKPSATDADGNSIKSSAFNVARSYINVSGNISHLVSYRITPDITRESGTGSSLNGSLTFRLKYAYAQVNLDDWLPKGTFIRFGIQQTPFIDFLESIYRYRFQGTVFPEREGYIASADAGVTFRTQFPRNYGDVHVGVYNGENYNKAEANDQKAWMIRASVRPLPMHPLLRGWRVTGFYIADHYIKSAEKRRAILNTTFEHKHLNAGFDYLDTKDQPSAKTGTRNLHGNGWSVFAVPKLPDTDNGSSWEVFLRYDHMKPNDEVTVVGGGGTGAGLGTNERTIAGLAYWFPKQGSVSAALMVDVENVTFSDYTPARPTQQRIFLHSLISF
ncbi:MAG: hypothetical protein EHM13_13465 [Acidobacteria bacterium]|nr:MAG: hypothetical protein EHM13_13465 [Acidobacteriota bacterium]